MADNLVVSGLVGLVLSGTLITWLAGGFKALAEGDASVPAWILAVGLVAIFGLGLLGGFLINRRRETDPIAAVAEYHQFSADLHAGYAEHLSRTLEQMKDAIAGALPGVTLAP